MHFSATGHCSREPMCVLVLRHVSIAAHPYRQPARVLPVFLAQILLVQVEHRQPRSGQLVEVLHGAGAGSAISSPRRWNVLLLGRIVLVEMAHDVTLELPASLATVRPPSACLVGIS